MYGSKQFCAVLGRVALEKATLIVIHMTVETGTVIVVVVADVKMIDTGGGEARHVTGKKSTNQAVRHIEIVNRLPLTHPTSPALTG